MCELKFRAWDGEHMLDVKEIVFTKTGVSVRTGFNSKYRSGVCKNPVVMQWIGLRDKNGKEIYAGDVIREVFRPDENFDDRVTVVQWNSRSCQFKPFGVRCDLGKTEVIGNIYENPELLAV